MSEHRMQSPIAVPRCWGLRNSGTVALEVGMIYHSHAGLPGGGMSIYPCDDGLPFARHMIVSLENDLVLSIVIPGGQLTGTAWDGVMCPRHNFVMGLVKGIFTVEYKGER